jgi:hypothetical protein
MPEPLIFDEDYTGPRWTYAMAHRPPGIGCQPDGRIIGADKPKDERGFYGTIQYDRELTDQEVYRFELEFVEYDSGLQVLTPGHGPGECLCDGFPIS